MKEKEREQLIAENAERNAREARDKMTSDERLEAAAKGRRTASDTKTSGEVLKDTYRG